ncbi:MAG: DUF58 domain-containing protein [Actinomycetota bacterium]
MSDPEPEERADLSAMLRSVELTVDRRLDGLLHGDYQGLLPGHGSELGEARPYVPGDDVRRIDWTVTARTRETHVRDTIADHELDTSIVLDRSGSLGVGSRRRTTGSLGLEIAAAIGFLVSTGGNRVGLLSTDGDGTTWLPHRIGRAHLRGGLARIAATPPSGEGDLAGALRRLAAVSRRRGFVAIVSDLHEPPGWERELRRLSSRHSVLVIEVGDPLDRGLPDIGFLTVVDAESGRRRVVDTSRRGLSERFAEAAERRDESRRRLVTGAGADHLRISTDGDWLAELVAHLRGRRRHRARRAVPR